MSERTCEDCPLHSRRAFLHDASLAVGVALAAIGMAPRGALAMRYVAAALSPDGTALRYPIPAADGVSIDSENEVIVVRTSGQVFAFSLACPHQRTALRWEQANTRFRCPKHKSVFRPDGTFVEGKAKRPMDRFAVSREGDFLVVDVRSLHRFDQAPDAWIAAVVRV